MAEKGKSGGGRGAAKDSGGASKDSGEQLAGPERGTTYIDGATFAAKPVVYSVVDGLAIFEGDIILGTVEEAQRRLAEERDRASGAVAQGVIVSPVVGGQNRRWPDCRIPFTIDPALPDQARVTNAIAHWEANTRFRFIARTTEPDFVTFQPDGGCSASVGRQGGQQFVNLAPGCSTGNAIHEIGHVVGLWHEQSREDRDAFVTINWAKIQPGMEHNFNQHITDGDDFGPYDYGSIMHYPRDAFSVDGSDTITPVDPAAVIGQRTALSPGDIAAANSMCRPPTIKEAPKDPIKEGPKDPIFDTFKEPPRDTFKEPPRDTVKEVAKDPIFDTFKEPPRDTVKEVAKDPITDTVKENVRDTIKEVALDPGGTFAERVTPVNPVVPGLSVGSQQGQLPFAAITSHQAPEAVYSAFGAQADPGAQIAELDSQLQQLAGMLAQLDAQRDELQAAYDELAAALAAAVQAAGG
jgi:hypothetical protein